MRFVICNKPRPDVGVPGAHHFQDRDGDQGRHRKRDHDLPQIFEITGAVHLGSQIQFVRDLQEILAEQVDVEHTDQERNDQDGVGLQPAKGIDRHVVRDREQFAGDHHGSEERSEQEVLALEFQTGKCERGKDRDDQRQKRRDHTDDDRVLEVRKKLRCLECFRVVQEVQSPRPEGRDRITVFFQSLQGRNDHPVEGEDDDERHQRKEQIREDLRDDCSCPRLLLFRVQVLLMDCIFILFRHDPHSFLNNGLSSC